jgi:predicted aspartyl protease
VGTFAAKLKIWNVNEPARAAELELLVDTGATYSWISRARLEALGVRSLRQMQLRTSEGRLITRDLAPVFVAADRRTAVDNVVMAEPGELEVMGALTLEALGLAPDVAQHELVPTIGLALRAGDRAARPPIRG